MDAEKRKALAEQLLGNPLIDEVLGRMHDDAVSKITLSTPDEDALRKSEAIRLSVIKSFRDLLEAELREDNVRKAAPV